MRKLNHLEKLAIYGALGLVVEVFFTAISEPTIILEGHTYIWMIPVWASGVSALEFVGSLLQQRSWIIRGFLYTLICFSVEFLWGIFFSAVVGVIPWDYSYADWNIHGIIRLDYMPFWFCAGLASEKLIALTNRLHIRIGK